MGSYNIYLFVTGLFYLANLQDSSTSWYVSEFPSFLRLNNIPLGGCTTFCLSIHGSIDTRVVSALWLLWVILLWTCVYKYLFETLLSILLAIYTEIELLDHRVNCLGEEKKERGVGNNIIVVQLRQPFPEASRRQEERECFDTGREDIIDNPRLSSGKDRTRPKPCSLRPRVKGLCPEEPRPVHSER